MNIKISNTSKVVTLNNVPARIWQGETDSGIKVVCFVTRVAVDTTQHNWKDYLSQFEKELQEQKAPSREIESFPLKMIIWKRWPTSSRRSRKCARSRRHISAKRRRRKDKRYWSNPSKPKRLSILLLSNCKPKDLNYEKAQTYFVLCSSCSNYNRIAKIVEIQKLVMDRSVFTDLGSIGDNCCCFYALLLLRYVYYLLQGCEKK